MEFKLIDGAYRISTDQKKELNKFLRTKLIKTKDGKLSKGTNFPQVFIDGEQKIFRSKGSGVWGFDSVPAIKKYQKNRQRKLTRLDPKATAKSKALEADKALMSMFTGEELGIEHSSRVHDFAKTNPKVGFGADDIQNKLISPVEDMKIKNALEAMTDANGNPWHIVSDNATGKPRIINIGQFNEFDPDDAGFVVDNLKEAELLRDSMKQGKNLGVDERKLAYLISERVDKTSTLDTALKQFKVYGSIQKTANKANKFSGISKLIENASTAAKTGKTIKTLQTGAKLATVGSLLALGPVGAAFGAVDTAQRTQKYKQTGNRMDGIQAWMSGVSTATGATGIGEIVSMPLDIVNLIMDAARYKRTGPIQGSRARFN